MGATKLHTLRVIAGEGTAGEVIAKGGIVIRPPPELPGHVVQRVHGYQARKTYVCPECGNPIQPGEGHVVVWPEEAVDLRRHWHHHCWRLHCVRAGGGGPLR